MVVIILEKVPVRLRGELSRWMVEPRAGVFIGRVSALVRDRLWERVCESCEKSKVKDPDKKPGALLICAARTEQGFAVRKYGDPSREVLDLEGLTLVRIPDRFKSSFPALELSREEPDSEGTATDRAE